MMDLEKEFNILIDDDDANCIRTVGQAIAYLESRIK
jgi:acyl carrier protein